MPQEPSKYAENQFESATRSSLPLMSEILADTRPRLATAATANALFNPPLVLRDAATRAMNALSVSVPDDVPFERSTVYQLWFQARNRRGSSSPRPKQTWTAP